MSLEFRYDVLKYFCSSIQSKKESFVSVEHYEWGECGDISTRLIHFWLIGDIFHIQFSENSWAVQVPYLII